jgi:REG-2-like HAD superfamily hydrolase
LIHPEPPVAEQYREAAINHLESHRVPSIEAVQKRFRTAFDHIQLPFDELRYGRTLSEGLWFWKRILSVVFPGADDSSLTNLTNELYEQFCTASAWSIYPQAEHVLDSLKDSGIKLGLLSNFDARGPTLIENLGLSSRFHETVFSSVVGIEKPERQIFQRMLDQLDDTLDRVMMIGNHVEIDLVVPDSMEWETLLHKPGSDDSWPHEVTAWNEVFEYLD